ncbi:hypothetical protein BH10BAC5_BH10BAC5_15210 [soil metagenome]
MKAKISLLFVVFLLSAFLQKSANADCCQTTLFTGVDKGVTTSWHKYPSGPTHTTWVGTIVGTVDGNNARFYCIDVDNTLRMSPTVYCDSSGVNDTINFILKNFYPYGPGTIGGGTPLADPNQEAAAVQFAIWWYSSRVDDQSSPISAINDRAKWIEDYARDHTPGPSGNVVKNLKIVPVSLTSTGNCMDTLKVRVLDGNGNPVSGKVVTLSTTGGTLSTMTVTTGADGYSPKFTITKPAHTTVTVSAHSTGQISVGTIYYCPSAPGTSQNATLCGNGSVGGNVEGNLCDTIQVHCDSLTSGGSGGVESSYDLGQLLLERHLRIQNGETTPLVANNQSVFNLSYTLQQLTPQQGPFYSFPVETTPFDILGISNATSAYAVDYKLNSSSSSRIAAIFATTTNAPDVYSHTKSVCDRLAGYNMENLDKVMINNTEFYIAKLVNQKNDFVDYSVILSVYDMGGSFKVDNKWTIPEYQVPAGTQNVYNFQIWGNHPETVSLLVQSVLSKFSAFAPVSYVSSSVIDPIVYMKSAKYTNDGKMNFKFINTQGVTKVIPFSFKYTSQQGSPVQTVNQNITVPAGETSLTMSIGYFTGAGVTMTNDNGFKDAVFIGGGNFASYAGPQSRIDLFQNINTSGNPSLGVNSLIFPGGIRMKGLLSDKVYIARSLDGSYDAVDLRNFTKLRFEVVGSGNLNVVLEAKMNGTTYYPIVTVPMTSAMTLREIPLTSFVINGQPVNLSEVTSIYFQMDKGNNTGISNFDYTVQNSGIIRNPLGITTEPGTPVQYGLTQNYPNPFNPATKINYSIPQAGLVTLKVYDNLGREVRSLVNEMKSAGEYNVTFDASELPSGIYFYKLISGNFVDTKKMLLVK